MLLCYCKMRCFFVFMAYMPLIHIFPLQTVYELQTLETRVARMPTIPITRLEDWREISRNVLKNARCYPVCVHQNLLEHCKNLVFSSPRHRRSVLRSVILGVYISAHIHLQLELSDLTSCNLYCFAYIVYFIIFTLYVYCTLYIVHCIAIFRELLEEIICTLIEQEYPINKTLYNSYLSTVWDLRLDISLDQVILA